MSKFTSFLRLCTPLRMTDLLLFSSSFSTSEHSKENSIHTLNNNNTKQSCLLTHPPRTPFSSMFLSCSLPPPPPLTSPSYMHPSTSSKPYRDTSPFFRQSTRFYWRTEAVFVESRKRVSVSQENYLIDGKHDISCKGRVKSLGVYIDATLSMAKHIDHISRSVYFEIRRISSIRHLLTTKATAQLMCSLVLSRLDCCNSLLVDINIQ